MDLDWDDVRGNAQFKADLISHFGRNMLEVFASFIKHDGSCSNYVEVRNEVSKFLHVSFLRIVSDLIGDGWILLMLYAVRWFL